MSTALQRLPPLRWTAILGAALAALLLTAGTLELALARKGFQPNLADSFPLWERQRQRVDYLGSRALVLVGNSRMLVDMDLGELRRGMGLEPVQLAVGGASFLPVLEDLAQDPQVTGTVLVNFEPQELSPAPGDLAAAYVAQRRMAPADGRWDFSRGEAALSDELHARLRSYADGSRPLSALLLRVTAPEPAAQYVRTLPDREQIADFSLASLPRLYYVRAIHEFPLPPPMPPHADLGQQRDTIERAIAALGSDDAKAYQGRLAAVMELAAAVRRHGGRVIFVSLPRTGYLEEIDDRRFPRSWSWDPLTKLPDIQALDFADVPALKGFRCPDGSHIDGSERAAFTAALVDALQGRSPKP